MSIVSLFIIGKPGHNPVVHHPANGRRDVAQAWNRVRLSHIKQPNTDPCCHTNKPQDHYAKCKEARTKDYLSFIYIKYPEKTNL